MSQVAAPTPARRNTIFFAYAIPAVVLAALLGGLLYLNTRTAIPALPHLTMPINPAIEATYGVRFKQVAITADGGLIDVRYTVIDANKAQTMMNAIATVPVITKSDGSADFRLQRPMNHKNELEAGRSSYILYVNKKGVLKPGDTVAILVGDMRLEPVVVK